MIRALAHGLVAHWRRYPLHLVTLFLGIALGTGLWSGVQAINAEARASYARAAATLSSLDRPRLVAPSGARLGVDEFVALRRAGVLVSPSLRGPWRPDPEGPSLTLIGLEPLTAPGDLWPGGSFEGTAARADMIFVAPGSAALGTRPDLAAQPGVPPGSAITDIATAQRLLGRDDFDALILAGPQPLGAPDPRAVLPGLRRIAPETDANPGALTESFHLNLAAFGALCMAVGLVIVRGAIGLTLAQRKAMLRVWHSLGVSRGRMLTMLLAELVSLAALAGLAGVVLGYGLAQMLIGDVAATLRGIYDTEIGARIALRPVWVLGGLALAIGGTLLAAIGPIWHLTGPRAQATAPLPLRLLTAAGALALMLAVGLARWGGNLEAGFGAIAALLLGGAALTPVLLHGLTGALARHLRRPLPHWIAAEARAQLPQMSLAMTAFLFAMAANIGVSTMVGSFRDSFTGFLDSRLAAELYLSGPADETALRAALAPGERLLPLRRAPIVVAGEPTDLYGVVDDATYRRDWRLLDGVADPWGRLYAGDGLVVNEQLFHRAELQLGDSVEIAGQVLPLVGVVADYGNPRGQAIVAMDRLAQLALGAETRSYGLRSNAPDDLRARLIAAGIAPDRLRDQAAVKAISLRIFERTFAVTGALNALTLAVAVFAILTALTALADMRLPRMAPLWAMGLSLRAISLAELARMGLLALLTAALALPLGLALSWLLLAVVNVEAFGWRLPFRPAPWAWMTLAATGVLAALAAALWPALILTRTEPRRVLELFSHDD